MTKEYLPFLMETIYFVGKEQYMEVKERSVFFFSSFWLVYILGCVALNVKNQYRTIKLEMIFWGGHVS